MTGKGRYTRNAEITCGKVYNCSEWKVMCCPLTEHNNTYVEQLGNV